MDKSIIVRMDDILERNPFLPMHKVVCKILREDIVSCKLLPEERLKEMECANRFGVSRTTIRRAFETLLSEGLIVQHGKCGLKVIASLSNDDYLQLVDMRKILDGAACQYAAYNRTYQDLTNMSNYISMADTTNIKTFYEADEAFHKAIYVATKNRYFLKAYRMLNIDLARSKMYDIINGIITLEEKQFIINEHKNIYNSIRNSNSQDAYKYGQKHVEIMMRTIERASINGSVK